MSLSIDIPAQVARYLVRRDIQDRKRKQHSRGVTIERIPQDNTVQRVLGPLLSTLVHDAECCVECEENDRVS